MKRNFSHLPVLSASLGLCLLAANTQAAPSIYLDNNGATTGSGVVNGGAYTWENNIWTTTSGGTTATGAFVEGDFIRFAAGTDATGNYSLTAGSAHTIGGLFQEDGATGSTVTIGGAGALTIDPTGGPAQGFIVRGSDTVIINSVLTGAGGVSFQTSGGTGTGSLFLNGNNSYSGGTLLTTGGGLNFNNNNSFGTGGITWNTAQAVLVAGGASPLNIANAMTTRAASQLIFVAPTAAPTTFSGTWTLVAGTSTISLGNTANPNTKMIVGPITGAGGNLVINANSTATTGNTFVFGASGNTYNGTTTLGNGATGGPKVVFGVANAIASSSSLIMNGSVLDLGGHNQSLGSTTLGLTASSTIDGSSGATTLSLANSSALTWTGGAILNFANWNPNVDVVKVGTDNTGLTPAQLAEIEFNGVGLGTATMDSLGDVYLVPEPSSIALSALGAAIWLARRRSRKA